MEKSYAEENAIGTVIPMQYKCEKKGCGSQFTLYWYQEGNGAGFR